MGKDLAVIRDGSVRFAQSSLEIEEISHGLFELRSLPTLHFNYLGHEKIPSLLTKGIFRSGGFEAFFEAYSAM